jgi:hypothetical protein
MAANKCGADNVPAVHLFSNPTKTAFGAPAGSPTRAFCARAINETASAVARYRSAGCQPGSYYCELTTSCIPISSCCIAADCAHLTYQQRVYCPAPGRSCTRCSAAAGLKQCGAQCIAANTCCAELLEDDCTAASPDMFCPKTGSTCAPKPPPPVTQCAPGQLACRSSKQPDATVDCITPGSGGCCLTNSSSTCVPPLLCKPAGNAAAPALSGTCQVPGTGFPSPSPAPGTSPSPPPICPTGTHKRCGQICIRIGSCCRNADCSRSQQGFTRCSRPGGRCVCPAGARACSGKCVPRSSPC